MEKVVGSLGFRRDWALPVGSVKNDGLWFSHACEQLIRRLGFSTSGF